MRKWRAGRAAWCASATATSSTTSPTRRRNAMLGNMLRLALQAIRRNVLRSSLTVLGIVIGVAAVISMVTIGAGATAKVTNDLSRLGTNLLTVRPGQGYGGPGGARADAPMFKL